MPEYFGLQYIIGFVTYMHIQARFVSIYSHLSVRAPDQRALQQGFS